MNWADASQLFHPQANGSLLASPLTRGGTAATGGLSWQGLDCTLECTSATEHLGQILSGFAALRHRGLVRVGARRSAGYSGNFFGTPILHVLLSTPALREPIRVTFDTSDSCSVPDDLWGSQYLFIRSFRPEVITKHPARERIFPLGLNCAVFTGDAFVLKRALWARQLKDGARILAAHSALLSRVLGIQNSIATCHPSCFEGLPIQDDNPRVIFMTQAWVPERWPEGPVREERYQINAMRAACIRALRAEFGEDFVGGFSPTPYAEEHFPDCVGPDQTMSRKKHYLAAMHSSSVCVSTVGLAGSTGWKLAEYVAAAKAIVTEPLLSWVPGDFTAGRNYLEFISASECVARVAELMANSRRRHEMMQANFAYYHSYMRPDVLVWNALSTVLAEARS